MVEINPSAPNPHDPSHKANPHAPAPKPIQANIVPQGNKPFPKTGGWGAYKTWLGPKGYKEFQGMLCKNISHEISQEKVKEQKRKEVMRKSIDGDTDIYN